MLLLLPYPGLWVPKSRDRNGKSSSRCYTSWSICKIRPTCPATLGSAGLGGLVLKGHMLCWEIQQKFHYTESWRCVLATLGSSYERTSQRRWGSRTGWDDCGHQREIGLPLDYRSRSVSGWRAAFVPSRPATRVENNPMHTGQPNAQIFQRWRCRSPQEAKKHDQVMYLLRAKGTWNG